MLAALVAIVLSAPADDGILGFDTGYRGIWYSNQKQDDEYVYKYSGGLGTYCSSHLPFAVYAKEVNKTFFCYGGTTAGKQSLLHMVSYYDHAAGVVPWPTILLDKKTDDAHDNPVMALDAKGHIWIFSSSHGTARPSYLSVSRRPYDVTAFDRVWTTNFSYTQPHYIAGQGFLFLHTRYGGGRRLYQMTSPDGRTWSEPALYAAIEQGHYQASWSDGRKVGTTFNYHPNPIGLNARTNLYYMETADLGKTWTAADGQRLALPLTTIDNAALVHDYRAEGLKVYVMDVAFEEGRPALLYLTSRGYKSGPENGPRTWRVARWTGRQWSIAAVTESDNNYDMGSLWIEPGQWRIIGPTEQGPQAYNTGGEIALWESSDRGATWAKKRTMTAGSTLNHGYCRKVIGGRDDFYSLWADGHGRKLSESRLCFCDRAGNVRVLPARMDAATARPQPLQP